MNTPPATPVRPRDAGTLILLREAGAGHEVLVGRRAGRTRFMHGFFVFPGGAVDPEDARVGAASPLHPGIVAHARVAGRAGRARAIAVAAVRETYEETGLLLAAPGTVGELAPPVWGTAREQGLAPALGKLRFVGRAITPTRSAIRYHARFFVAHARHCHGTLGGNGELADLDWVPIAAVEDLRAAGVTRYMLERAVRVAASRDARPGASVLYSQRGSRRRVTVFADDPDRAGPA